MFYNWLIVLFGIRVFGFFTLMLLLSLYISLSLCVSVRLRQRVRQREGDREREKAICRLITLKQQSIYSQDKGRSGFSTGMKKLLSNQGQLDQNQ